MKYLILFLLGVMLFDKSYGQQIKVNPQAGLNYAQTFPQREAIDATGQRGSYQVGLDLRVGDFDHWVYWQPGVHYSAYNVFLQVAEPAGSAYDDSDFIKLSTLKIPIDVGLYLTGSDGILRVRTEAGLTPTVLLHRKESAMDPLYTHFQTFGLGLNAGVGVDIAFVTLDVNYEYGLSKMYNSGDGRINILSFTLGVVIPPTF